MPITYPIADISILAVRKELIEAIKAGKIFIYPTDTLYGIGCNAENEENVEKIRKIKQRDGKKPLSIIAPSMSWIATHVTNAFPNYLEKLPGPYTLLMTKKDKKWLSHVSETEKIGIRIPQHVFTKLTHAANVPFITTSVNFAGKAFATSIEEIPKSIISKVDYVIDAGPIHTKPSTIIDLTGKEPKIVERK